MMSESDESMLSARHELRPPRMSLVVSVMNCLIEIFLATSNRMDRFN
jgi:hypothetical protein